MNNEKHNFLIYWWSKQKPIVKIGYYLLAFSITYIIIGSIVG